MWVLRSALIVALVLLPAGTFRADTFLVTKTADTDDGTCDPDCSLREAIDAANANPGADDVPVPAGTYLLTLGQLVVSDDVTIAGSGQTSTIIDGNATSRVFDIEATSGAVAISGVTIQNGYVDDDHGGGILNRYGDLALTNSTLSDNIATYGGGIANYVWGNANYVGDLTLTNCTVSGNNAYLGGGVSNFSNYSDLTLINSTVSSNTAIGSGGGIRNSSNYGVLTLTNSTVSGNTARFGGGGITNFAYTKYSTLTNSTVSGNTADYGGAILGYYFALTNTVVADNVTNCDSTSVESLGHNLTDDDSCGFTAPGDLIVADAMLGPLQDNGGPTETHALLAGSPAIDAGSPDCPPPATDQRGVARPQGAACDIGAVEYLPEPRGSLALIVGAGFLGFIYPRKP